MLTVLAELYCSINCLKEALLIDASNDEVALVDGFRTFGRGADADGREGMANAGEEATLLWQCTRIGNDCKGIHLEAVVVVEAERLMLDDALVELEAACSKAVA